MNDISPLISNIWKFSATEAERYVVTGNSVNVRTEPSTSSRILVQLSQGTEVDYVKRYNNDWTVINYDGQEAYVSSQYIEKKASESEPSSEEDAESASGTDATDKTAVILPCVFSV